ncbi:MAG: signal peptidase [Legionellaceae bacterium]|mgnify:FL=1|nr:signal peptidase [Legionellaceae bacterium]HAF87733.1 signal peptidase [Legionellales bacterium]|tara:strand:- start:1929 stop:2951 length:1023 start_codon:yes stop_codon:yes gene_type:complete
MRYFLGLLLITLSFNTFCLTLKPDAPKRYVVKPKDTLWDIANRYLAHPWEWKKLWYANPQIKNPKRLYVGAVIYLDYYQKRPYLQVLSNGTIKLSPHIRPMQLGQPIPAIPLTDIQPFLNASLVMDKDKLQQAPYVVAFIGEHMLGGQGDEVYVKNLCAPHSLPAETTVPYTLYRPGKAYIEPISQRVLGYKATLVGYGQLVKAGNPATILLTEITEGVRLKDRVMLDDFPEFKLYFEPKAPNFPIKASIIDLPPNYTQGAVGLVATLNRGQDAGLEAGDVLAIYKRKRIINDPLTGQALVLPKERLGELMIFRTFSQTSFALVVRSTRAIHLHDVVTNP